MKMPSKWFVITQIPSTISKPTLTFLFPKTSANPPVSSCSYQLSLSPLSSSTNTTSTPSFWSVLGFCRVFFFLFLHVIWFWACMQVSRFLFYDRKRGDNDLWAISMLTHKLMAMGLKKLLTLVVFENLNSHVPGIPLNPNYLDAGVLLKQKISGYNILCTIDNWIWVHNLG